MGAWQDAHWEAEQAQREYEKRWEKKREADEIRNNYWATPGERFHASELYREYRDRPTAYRMDEETVDRIAGRSCYDYDYGYSGSRSSGNFAAIIVWIVLIATFISWLFR